MNEKPKNIPASEEVDRVIRETLGGDYNEVHQAGDETVSIQVFEKKPEHIPTPEEIHNMFKELIKGEYRETRRLEDEQGVYLLEVEVIGKTPGETIEYGYMRKGRHGNNNETSQTGIQTMYYQYGFPVSGDTVASLINDKWKMIEPK